MVRTIFAIENNQIYTLFNSIYLHSDIHKQQTISRGEYIDEYTARYIFMAE